MATDPRFSRSQLRILSVTFNIKYDGVREEQPGILLRAQLPKPRLVGGHLLHAAA